MSTTPAADPGATLRQAFDEMLKKLAAAREAIEDRRLHPPPPTERHLALGYPYLLGFLHGAIERAFADPRYPRFEKAIHPVAKSTIDNADALYLRARIDPEQTYRVMGHARDCRHWRGAAAAPSGRKAPQYVIFEATTAYPGDSGGLAELRPEVRANTGTLDSTALEVADDGSFELEVGPERRAGHSGNFIATRAGGHGARWLIVRELFHEWDREDPLELEIVRVGSEEREPASPLEVAHRLEQLGEMVNNQMRFWNAFYAIVLETYADMNGDGKRMMPRNDLNLPEAAPAQRGGGQSTNVYAGGVFELGPEEALVVETRTPVRPAFFGFHLSDLWGQSLDYEHRQTSLNAAQAVTDADGACRFVIAHRDPEIANWLDTTGLPEGFMTVRWTYPQAPARPPTVKVEKVALASLREKLPADTRTATREDRRAALLMRQRHVQRRYRA